MAGFIPPHRQQQFLRASTEFFQWWLAELTQLLPQKWRAGLLGRQAACRLSLDGGRLALTLETQGRETALGSAYVAALSPGDALPPGIDAAGQASAKQQLLAHIAALDSRSQRRVVLELADDYLLIRDISLPLVSDADLVSVLAHEIDRLSPFQKNNVCYSYELLEKNAHTGKLRLRLICLERAVLERLLVQCLELGLKVTKVLRKIDSSQPESFSETFSETRNLLPLDQRPAKEKLWNSANQGMAGLALLLLLAVLMLPPWHYENQIAALSTEVDALLEQSKVVRAKQARLVSALDVRDALVARKNSEFEKIIILHNLARIIPDNTWLTRVTIRDSALEIEGESEKSSDLIEKLESQAAFNQVEFASSVTRNSLTGKERFQIKMQLSDKPDAGLNSAALDTELDTESEPQTLLGAKADE
ncbi:MAG: PilN domain-containing protein [Gammaproteobacteria bacterium]|nr:PilN domain-containing protein [Gammaproteobacteria bacterium]MBQ0838743.1 PilN domain-containing protein [Gammaproteobacteria bacterium]